MRFALSMFLLVGLLPVGASGQATEDAHSRYTPTGPPPTQGYEPYDQARSDRAQRVISGVPAYLWQHGCGPTAAGMVIGYWDGQGFPLLIPGNASSQTSAVNQAIASTEHYNDYSLPIDAWPNPISPDKSTLGGAHSPHNCLADFMSTSWSSRNLYYGWSYFSDVDNSLEGYTNVYASDAYGATYTGASWNQAWGTFTWSNFRTEIDNDRPMVFLVDSNGDGETDHFVTAIGYRDTNGYQEYACFDTWSTGVRWERFRAMSSSYSWGIYGATYFDINLVGCTQDSDCDDGVVCTEDKCIANECVFIPKDEWCDNGQWCDGAEWCDVLNDCQPGVPPDCDDGVGCTDDTCNEVTDTCDHIPNDVHCDNGQWCDGAEWCHATLDCQPGVSPDCDDGVGCTNDTCNEVTDTCDHIPNDAYCDNGVFCDGAEWCDLINDCRPGTYPCAEPTPCCDEVLDVCWAPPENVILVDAGATGANNGECWDDAYNDLQDALDAVDAMGCCATGGCEIWVATGVYKPDRGMGDRLATFQLRNCVGVYGGFDGWEHVREDRVGLFEQTILSGDLNGDDGPDFANNGENAHHVVTGSGCDGTAILDGFTLTGGNANRNYPRNCGGGMFNVSGSPTVANCRFEANVAYDGAGMHNRDYSSPSVTDCDFVGNVAGQGGAISNLNRSSPPVTNCLFEDNLARCWDGGALYCVNYSRPTVLHSRFRGNAANYDGGSVCNLHWSSPRFYNCEFTNELAGGAGGVMYCFNGSQAKMIGCTLSNNTAANGAALAFDSFAKGEAVVEARTGEFWRDNLGKTVHAGRGLVLDCGSKEESTPRGTEAAQGPSNVYVANSIVWDGADGIWNADGSTVTIVYSDVYGGWPGEGNLDADPLFVDAGSGNFRLTLGSPCVDAGSDPLVPAGITTDLDGSPRIVDGNLDGILTVDMGAYELQGSGLLAGDFDGDGDVDLDDFGVFEGCFSGRLAVVSGDCARCDVNQDTFIDLQDFAWFQRAFRP